MDTERVGNLHKNQTVRPAFSCLGQEKSDSNDF